MFSFSLLSLPPEALQRLAQHDGKTTCGTRNERRFAFFMLLVSAVGVVVVHL